MNVQRKAKDSKGFTIIEVVLVLAIAGLIFLMVFIALPALQRNQRDAARKAEVGTVAGAITTFQSNNRGVSPGADATFANYIDATIVSNVVTFSSGTKVKKSAVTTFPQTVQADTETIIFVIGGKCGAASSAEVIKGTSRQTAVVVQLENGDAFYCQAT